VISISGVLPINERIEGGLSGKVDLAGVALLIKDWRIDQRRAGDHRYATLRVGIVKRATTWPSGVSKWNPPPGAPTFSRRYAAPISALP
jgi:hypothetical protein